MASELDSQQMPPGQFVSRCVCLCYIIAYVFGQPVKCSGIFQISRSIEDRHSQRQA